MSRSLAALYAFVILSFTLLLAAPARAQTRTDITANVDNDTVEIGDTIVYSQQVMAHNTGVPSDPRPGPIPGFAITGNTSAPVNMRMNVNGAVDEVHGLMTSWTLRATKVGSFTLGPSQVTIGGKPRTGGAVRVRVVERGKGTGRPRGGGRPPVDPLGGNPFDPFKGLFDFDDPRAQQPAAPSADPTLAMDRERAPVAFLHATVDKTRAVVGEQITLAVYLYEDPYSRQGRPGDVHEATASDFVKRSLIEDETRAVGVGTAMVAGKLWNVKIVRKNALFPLKTGHLTIEPMSMTLPQARVGLRASETLYVDVTEPPVAGRPAGYAVGDVGDMAMQATVAPRAIQRDSAVGITVELRGTGNLPSALTVPTVPGVEWLEPQTRDKLGAMQNDRFGGTRTFNFVVRIHKEGPVDLGEVRLPFYDADKRSYGVARAALGTVNVSPGPVRDAGADQAEVVLGGMPKERRVLEGPHPQTYLTERPVYWAALFGSPLACALAIGAHGLFGRLRERRANAAPSVDKIAKTRREGAEDACRGSDGKTAMGAVARAVEAEVLAKTGVNVRGAAGDTAKLELEEAGVSTEEAARLLAILRACEDARFSPDGVAIEAARETWTRARSALDALDAPAKADAGSKTT